MDKKYEDIVFLALCVWREARGEKEAGQVGVAQCIMNRVKRPGWWGNDVKSVIFKKWQFSSLTDPRDRQLTVWPEKDTLDWIRAIHVAEDVVEGRVLNPVLGADSYHDISIPSPKWTKTARYVTQLGRIKFYDVDHDYEV